MQVDDQESLRARRCAESSTATDQSLQIAWDLYGLTVAFRDPLVEKAQLNPSNPVTLTFEEARFERLCTRPYSL